MTFNEYPNPDYIKDFSNNPMTQWQRECQKNHRFNKQNNNFVYASHFFVHFFAALICHYCDIKMPSFAFYGEHKLVTMQFYFSF